MKGKATQTTEEYESKPLDEFEPSSELAREQYEQEQRENAEYQKIIDMLSLTKDVPSLPQVSDIRNWKSKYSKIHISSVLDDTNMYVWRPISRAEWKKFVAKEYKDPDTRQSELLKLVLLFPKTDTVLFNRPAGVLPSLETQIMYQSGFIDDQTLLSQIKEIH